MPDSSRPVADMDKREPSTSARAARTAGGVALTTILLPAADVEGFEVIDAVFGLDNDGSGCMICPRMEFPFPPNMPPFNVGFEDEADADAGASDGCNERR